jgi:peptidoglycan/xylan/chitin deacetylase (PgdA/CDA1 family)
LNHFSPPLLIQKLFGNFIWSTTNNKILLTFDDGPTESSTKVILNSLVKHKIKALFFCVGNNIKKHPELAAQILSEGHSIANHTMKHKLLTEMNRKESVEEIISFNRIMKEQFNYDVKYFRPAHGRFNLRTNGLMEELSLKCVMWNLLTYDYQHDLNKVKYSIDNYLKKNSIIVFHDSIKSTCIIEESLNYTIEQARNNGFTIGEPEDCLR